jgi:hypothetical protein
VERDGGDLEAEPDEDESETGQQKAGREQRVGGQEVGDSRQRRRTGGAVDHRHAVEHHRRGERAEDEVLEAGLAGLQPAAVEGGEHVEGDREDLEGQEHDDEVVGRRHQEHPRG